MEEVVNCLRGSTHLQLPDPKLLHKSALTRIDMHCHFVKQASCPDFSSCEAISDKRPRKQG